MRTVLFSTGNKTVCNHDSLRLYILTECIKWIFLGVILFADTTTLTLPTTRRTVFTQRPTFDPYDGCGWAICWRERPCMNYGMCIFLYHRPYYRCRCMEGYSGRHCETRML